MRIDNTIMLDEAQGLTPDMVREWLRKQGCEQVDGGWRHPNHAGLYWESQLTDCAIDLIAYDFGYTAQELLRAMNPRMRKGMPSAAARKAHEERGGVWIACSGELGRGGTILFVSFTQDGPDGLPIIIWEPWAADQKELAEEWYFWPCDEHGNKVRWPEKDGVML